MSQGNYRPETLRHLAISALEAVGVPAPDAGLTADVLLDADLRGQPSHGIMRLPLYVDRVQRGVMTARPAICVISDRPAMTHLDADYALGPVASAKACDLAIAKAETGGIGLVLLRRASHFGTAGFHARRLAAAGLVGIVASNTAAMLVPPGGRRAAVGNSPLAIALPDGAGGAAFVTDLSFGAAALGKIILARSESRPIPPDWALDKEGQPTTDPAAALASGLMQAMAGAKGLALALAVEAMTGLLAGADFGTGVKSIYRDPDERQNLGQLFLAIDPTAFLAAGDYAARIAALRAMVTDAAAPGAAPPRLPGDRGQQAMQAGGPITLPAAVIADLSRMVASLGLDPLPPERADP